MRYCFSSFDAWTWLGPDEEVLEKQVRCILFDFDGTIVDSVSAALDTWSNLSVKYGGQPFDRTNIREHSIKDVIAKHVKLPWYKRLILPLLLVRAHHDALELMAERILKLQPFPGMKDALTDLKKQGFVLGIVSSNSEQTIKQFLKNNNLELFDHIYAGSSLFGKHHILNDFLDKHGFDPKEVIYVGDETRDIEAAKKSGIAMVAVDWGFNSAQKLSEFEPEHLISNPYQIMDCALLSSYQDA